MKRVLVTGGAGFIGSHVCDRLYDEGHEVLCLDNFYTGSRRNIEHLQGQPRFEILRHDITHPIFLEVDEILHLACPASPVHYQSNPIKTIKTNVIGTMHALGIAKRVHARILLASTSEVYGDPQQHPQTESYLGNVNQLGPRGCYDEGKRVAETLMMDYHRQLGVDVKIVRIFNTYGPRMQLNDGRVVSNHLLQALKNEPITIYGEGSQTRAFCYVTDLVEGIFRMMGKEDFIGPVNLGNPGELTILQLAEMIKELTGSRSEIKFSPAVRDDPGRRDPDITLAGEKLGWEPTISLEEGLRRTLSYFEKILSEG